MIFCPQCGGERLPDALFGIAFCVTSHHWVLDRKLGVFSVLFLHPVSGIYPPCFSPPPPRIVRARFTGFYPLNALRVFLSFQFTAVNLFPPFCDVFFGFLPRVIPRFEFWKAHIVPYYALSIFKDLVPLSSRLSFFHHSPLP